MALSTIGSDLQAILDSANIASTSKTFTFPNTTGTLALTSDIPAAGANTALSNLASVAINTNLTTAVGVNWAGSATAPAAANGASQVGKTVSLSASNAVASLDTAGAAAGGAVTITSGNAARLTSGNANGGDINLVAGTGIGSGIAGNVVIPSGVIKFGAVGSGVGSWLHSTGSGAFKAGNGTSDTAGSFQANRFVTGGNEVALDPTFSGGGLGLASSKLIFWSSTSSWSGTADAGLARTSASVLNVNNGTSGQWGSLLLGTRDAGTTTVTNGLTLGHQSTGTPAAGLGSAVLFNINSSTTADQNAAQISSLWTDATHASRTADIVFKNVDNAAALAETLRIKATGHLVTTAPVRLKGYTVATLPAGTEGDMTYVTDQLTAPAAKGAPPTGGGAVKCVVFYDGAAWVGI